MRFLHYGRAFLVLFFFTSSIYAEDFKVPTSWEKVAEAQDGDISSISIRDGWIAWMEKRLDTETAMHVAQSFFVTLYRQKLGTSDKETLILPDYSRTWGDIFILGENGVVSRNYRGNSGQLIFPLKSTSPILLCSEERVPKYPMMMGNTERRNVLGQGKNTPIRIYKDEILCLNTGNYPKIKISLIPYNETQPNFTQQEVLVEIEEREVFDACWDDKYLLYSTDKSLTLYNNELKSNCVTFEAKRKGLHFNHLYLYQDFVYFRLSNYIDFGDAILRFSIKDQKFECMVLPQSCFSIINFNSQKVLFLTKRESRIFEMFEADMLSGKITQFDFSMTNVFELISEGMRIGNARFLSFGDLYFCGDAATSKILAAYKNNLYLISKTKKTIPWPSFGWTTTMQDEIKDSLAIKDENGKEIKIEQ